MTRPITSAPSQIIARTGVGPQTRDMDAQQKATIREAAGRHPVNAFRLHHFAGLGCSLSV